MDEPINILNLSNDTLCNILSYLDIEERINIDYVCKRFFYLPKKHWKNIRSLTVDREYIYFFDMTMKYNVHKLENNDKNLKMTTYIYLKRGGIYLKTLDIFYNNYKTNYDLLNFLNNIVKYCCNVESLKFVAIIKPNDNNQCKKMLNDLNKLLQKFIKVQKKLNFSIIRLSYK